MRAPDILIVRPSGYEFIKTPQGTNQDAFIHDIVGGFYTGVRRQSCLKSCPLYRNEDASRWSTEEVNLLAMPFIEANTLAGLLTRNEPCGTYVVAMLSQSSIKQLLHACKNFNDGPGDTEPTLYLSQLQSAYAKFMHPETGF